jgi:transcription initiation factor TFIIIB Brf1 subunit/transcription initiation factor TFIIB
MAQSGKDYGKRPGVVAARLAYLYGVGDGKPVVSTKRLAEIGECTEKTILRHIPEWHKEKEELIVNAPETELGLRLSKETLDAHKKDLAFLRSDLNSIKWEMSNLDNSIAKLEGICENFSLNSDNGDDALKLFDRYLRASLNKSSLRSQFLAAQKRWVELSGVEAVGDVQVTAAKALATGQVKLALKREETETGPKEAVAATGIFARE